MTEESLFSQPLESPHIYTMCSVSKVADMEGQDSSFY